MNNYQTQKQIGDGAYGTVFKAISLKNKQVVAIKKIKQAFTDVNHCLNLPEVQCLQKLQHKNIIALREVLLEQNTLNLVFDFQGQNLFELYSRYRYKNKTMPESLIKLIIYQVAQGLHYIHKQGYFHRDLKPENILYQDQQVKICDFGLAKEIKSKPPYTEYIATRWYRAPEILLKSRKYNFPVDIFALGCIMAELFLFRPLFEGDTEIDQINKIINTLGTINYSNWQDGIKLATIHGYTLPESQGIPLESILQNCSQEGIDLLYQMLQYDPSKRITAYQVIHHPYFNSVRSKEDFLQFEEPIDQKQQMKEEEKLPCSLPPIQTNKNDDKRNNPFKIWRMREKSKGISNDRASRGNHRVICLESHINHSNSQQLKNIIHQKKPTIFGTLGSQGLKEYQYNYDY